MFKIVDVEAAVFGPLGLGKSVVHAVAEVLNRGRFGVLTKPTSYFPIPNAMAQDQETKIHAKATQLHAGSLQNGRIT